MRSRQQRPPRLTRVRADNGGRIYYVTPDYIHPAGGIRVIYRHVDHLNDAGIAASVLHGKSDFRCTWFENDTRVDSVRSVRIGDTDLLVFPEIYAGQMPNWVRNHDHVIFHQSAYLTFRRGAAPSIAAAYREAPGLRRVLTVSEYSQRLLSYMFPDSQVERVRVGVDTKLFCLPEEPGQRVITYMPRRGGDDAAYVVEALRQRGALRGWELRALDGLPHDRVAAELRNSTVFLSFTYQEGFGLPAAEAMACGNVVIGFDGCGGREFFLPEFSFPIPPGDLLAFASTVEAVIDDENRDPGRCRVLGERASAHITSLYSLEAERTDVLEFFASLLPSAVGSR
jgi:glycosyltransferase involved in cell wall biosynthesis